MGHESWKCEIENSNFHLSSLQTWLYYFSHNQNRAIALKSFNLNLYSLKFVGTLKKHFTFTFHRNWGCETFQFFCIFFTMTPCVPCVIPVLLFYTYEFWLNRTLSIFFEHYVCKQNGALATSGTAIRQISSRYIIDGGKSSQSTKEKEKKKKKGRKKKKKRKKSKVRNTTLTGPAVHTF